MAQTASYVTAAKPAIGGAIYAAAAGTTLPTDATTSLAAAFKPLGYVSEDGITNNEGREVEWIKAFGGDEVLPVYTGKSDKYGFTLLETENTEVLKFVHGDDNVTVGSTGTTDLDKGITVKHNAKELESHAIAIDLILRDGILKRIVIPDARIETIGEVTYSDSTAIGYEVTLGACPDANGNTAYEYLKKPAAGSNG